MSELQVEKIQSNGAARSPLWHVTPELDLFESGSEYLILLDMPGATPEGVSIQVQGTRVQIKAEQAASNPEREVARVAFERQIELPGEVDVDSASAKLEAGVLEIKIAKSASARRVKIAVKAN